MWGVLQQLPCTITARRCVHSCMKTILTSIVLACACLVQIGCKPANQDPLPADYVIPLFITHNDARRQSKVTPLKADWRLDKLAQDHAEWMARRGSLRHSSLSDVPYSRRGENIAMGQRDARSVTKAWMNSRGHRRNILDPNFTHVGFGYAETKNGTPYWCTVFGGGLSAFK